MPFNTNKTQPDKSTAATGSFVTRQGNNNASSRPAVEHKAPIARDKIQRIADNSSQVKQLKALQQMADKRSIGTLQAKAGLEEEETAQKKSISTSLSGTLRSGIEHLRGMDVSDIKKQYSSAQPAQLLQAKDTAINNEPGPAKEVDVTGTAAEIKSPLLNLGLASRKAAQLKRSAYSLAGEPVAQRVVINLDTADPGITDAAKTAKARQVRSLGREVSVLDDTWSDEKKQLRPPITEIANVNPNEPLVILAHGLPAIGNDDPQVAGRTARQLYNELVQFGLTRAFKGVIDLSNCTSAWSRNGQASFAESFYNILQENGHTNKVTGFRSFVSSPNIDSDIEINHAQRERALIEFMIKRYTTELQGFYDAKGGDEAKRDKRPEAAKLATGYRLVLAEIHKMQAGTHSNEYIGIWVKLLEALRAPVQRGAALTQDEAMEAQDNLLKLHMAFQRKENAPVTTVPAVPVEFNDDLAYARSLGEGVPRPHSTRGTDDAVFAPEDWD